MKLDAVFVPPSELLFSFHRGDSRCHPPGEAIEEERANIIDALRMVLDANRDLARRENRSSSVREELELSAL